MFKSLMHATCRDNSSRRTSHCRDPLQRHFRRRTSTAKDWSTNASQRLAPLQGTNLLQGLDKLQRLDSAAKVPSVVILGSAEEVGSAAKAASAATATDQVSRLPLFPFSGASAMTNLLWPKSTVLHRQCASTVLHGLWKLQIRTMPRAPAAPAAPAAQQRCKYFRRWGECPYRCDPLRNLVCCHIHSRYLRGDRDPHSGLPARRCTNPECTRHHPDIFLSNPSRPVLMSAGEVYNAECPICLEQFQRGNDVIRLKCDHICCLNCWKGYVHCLPDSVECVLCRKLAGEQILCTYVDEEEATDEEATASATDEEATETSVLHSPDVAQSDTVHQNGGYQIFRDTQSDRLWIQCEGGQRWFWVFHSPDDARFDSMHQNGGYEIYCDPQSGRYWIWYVRTKEAFFLSRWNHISRFRSTSYYVTFMLCASCFSFSPL